jgi:predicted transcriptional regulator
MAVSKTDLLDFVTQYQTDNKRPCPKSHIVATHGEDSLEVLKSLVEDKSIACRRGRNGGYFPTTAAAPVEVSSEVATDAPIEEGEVADQFAALEAKLAALEAAEAQSEEAAPF